MKTDTQSAATPALAVAPCSAAWDIRLQCTVCGVRVRRNRRDYDIGDQPRATVTTECSNCTCNAGYPMGGVQTIHFIDYATMREIAE